MKHKLGILINSKDISLKNLPITKGQLRVKRASSSMVMGKSLAQNEAFGGNSKKCILLVELIDIHILVKWNGKNRIEVHIPDDFTESRVSCTSIY